MSAHQSPVSYPDLFSAASETDTIRAILTRTPRSRRSRLSRYRPTRHIIEHDPRPARHPDCRRLADREHAFRPGSADHVRLVRGLERRDRAVPDFRQHVLRGRRRPLFGPHHIVRRATSCSTAICRSRPRSSTRTSARLGFRTEDVRLIRQFTRAFRSRRRHCRAAAGERRDGCRQPVRRESPRARRADRRRPAVRLRPRGNGFRGRSARARGLGRRNASRRRYRHHAHLHARPHAGKHDVDVALVRRRALSRRGVCRQPECRVGAEFPFQRRRHITRARVNAFRRSIALVEALPCDILLSVHPEFSGTADKLERRRQHPDTNPFIDPGGCRAYAAAASLALDRRIADERAPTK